MMITYHLDLTLGPLDRDLTPENRTYINKGTSLLRIPEIHYYEFV